MLRPTLESRQGDELVAHAVAGADSGWFGGHFPGRPILPGVALVALVEDALARLWPDEDHGPAEVRSLRRVRFRKVIGPGANLRVRLRQIQPDLFRFSVEVDGLPASTGECLTVSAAPELSRPSLASLLPTARERQGARFCSDGTTVAAIADRAGQLGKLADAPAAICVASEDRAEVAAALWAALSGRAVALFPPALSAEAVVATERARRFSHWIGPAAWGSALPPPFAANAVAWSVAMGASAAPCLGDADHACVFLHTGGTTGTPRGWAKTPRNLLEEIAVQIRVLQAGPGDHVLATVPPHHIYGLLFSVLLPLCSGATVERQAPFFPQEIADCIAHTGATILVSTPAHLKALASVMHGPHRLRLVLSSGAPLSAADAKAFFTSTGLWPLEVYGSTETGGIAIRRQDLAEAPWRPLPGVSCRLSGEVLAVRSSFVSADAPFDAEGFFETADLASLRADGSFDLAGRADGVVKVGGVRVLLPDIEKAILALDQVSDVAVLALPSDSGRGQEIVALVASARPAEAILRELRERLPSPSWPRRLRTVAALPTTPSGKRDRGGILQFFDGSGAEAG